MRTRILTYVGIGAGIVLFLVGTVLWATWMADEQKSDWRETCASLDSELIDTPKFYGCARDGEVVYPK
jgi:hypothetical protein